MFAACVCLELGLRLLLSFDLLPCLDLEIAEKKKRTIFLLVHCEIGMDTMIVLKLMKMIIEGGEAVGEAVE